MKPIIGVNCEYDEDGKCFLSKEYTDAIVLAGGIPFLLPIVEDKDVLMSQVDVLDGLMLSGGKDVLPEQYGETLHRETNPVPRHKGEFDFLLVNHALELDMPILALCYGHQLVNVCLGGNLIQDIPSQYKTSITHRTEGTHNVCINKESKLYNILGRESIASNSTHHQAIKDLGENVIKSAVADDGIIEGVESTRHTFVVCVQWHPERLLERDTHTELFRSLVGAAVSFREKRKIKRL